SSYCVFFFFQAEDGIRDFHVTGVQTCSSDLYVAKAHINQDLCIKCGRCHIACEDTSHQAITAMVDGVRHFEVLEEECVGCNLCVNVCPVENCITMQPLPAGTLDKRTGKPVSPTYANWTMHPHNPMAKAAAE